MLSPGSVYAWGMGTNLQLGTGEEDDEWSPVKMTGKQLENRVVLSASSGGQHTALLVKDKQESWCPSHTEAFRCFTPGLFSPWCLNLTEVVEVTFLAEPRDCERFLSPFYELSLVREKCSWMLNRSWQRMFFFFNLVLDVLFEYFIKSH